MVGFWIRKVRPERFSVYMNSFKTNNYVENFHLRIGSRVPYHANFFRFVKEFKLVVFQRTLRLINQVNRGEKVKNDITADAGRHKE
jgi:hypothetical protein